MTFEWKSLNSTNVENKIKVSRGSDFLTGDKYAFLASLAGLNVSCQHRCG